MLPPQSGNETNVKLPFSFFFYSLLALILSQAILLLNGTEFAAGHFRVPALWAFAHLFILGWALMIAMGSMYQLVPVAFLTPIWSEKFGFIQFIVQALGVTSFAGFLYWAPQKALIPGIITVLGILMFLFQMFMTLKKQTKRSILTAFVGSGLVFLFLTILLGITLILSWRTGFLAEHYTAIFKSHLLFGIGGWFTLLIFGFSYKMVPMFSLSHGYSMKLAKYVFIAYLTGMITTTLSFWLNQAIIQKLGFFLLFIGFGLFAWHISKIVAKAIKKKLDVPFMFALSGIGFGLLIHVLFFISLFNRYSEKLIGPLLFLYLMLWIVLSLLGYLYKIVPFLWWTHKYSKLVGKEKVPALKDMMNEKLSLNLLMIFIFSCITVYFGIILQLQILAISGLVILALTLISTAISILVVIFK
ncbi:hypothetical protein [Pseudoneobacillus sp. C159]